MSLLFRRRGRSAPARPAPGAPLAEASDLHVRLGQREVLDGIELTARAGEVLALVGPNGAGKSTLLGALAADLPAASGVVRIDGRPVGDWSAPELALRRSVLPQSAALAFPFPVEDVVRMGRAPWAGTPYAESDGAAVAAAMAATEVTGFAERPFSALSGGERARVALARVLAQGAPLLLLDEPTAALDLATRSWCCGSAGSGPPPGAQGQRLLDHGRGRAYGNYPSVCVGVKCMYGSRTSV
ncbi:hemin import ATP-binding protein hmuV [Streptomyces sp. Mg1]|nr:hemin import ATP-binding protein hmuV [Streptomyces sp. Mg1]